MAKNIELQHLYILRAEYSNKTLALNCYPIAGKALELVDFTATRPLGSKTKQSYHCFNTLITGTEANFIKCIDEISEDMFNKLVFKIHDKVGNLQTTQIMTTMTHDIDIFVGSVRVTPDRAVLGKQKL